MKLLLATQGDYSDYSVICVLDWISDRDPEVIGLEWYAEQSKENEYARLGAEAFVHFCIKAGYAVELELKELHLGSYGSIKANIIDKCLPLTKEQPHDQTRSK